jgi:hypothetical protein
MLSVKYWPLMLSVVMLNVVILNVAMLSVVAPAEYQFAYSRRLRPYLQVSDRAERALIDTHTHTHTHYSVFILSTADEEKKVL